ncbi:hypothetical protein LV476_06000 [Guyparkeria hydrothermalis]|uniref:hypothetical protein n=1 Tax=Guyparkeria hydrothermalis TaxID=923 RepID=UPI00202125EC|nr:hypothetical protein [Guyparkeria hydrothermalis]MCL7744503.1 hypothetical protein [Guyparkeria hydrothermalis]
MIANVESGYSNVAAADGLLSQPTNQQTTNPSAQTRNTPVENPPENRVNGSEAVAAGQNRAGEDQQAGGPGGNIDVRV